MSKIPNGNGLFGYFQCIHDARQDGKVHHKLLEVIFIVVAATICRCDDWEEMEEWAKTREEWLREYLELSNGIPSKSTLCRVFSFIDPKQFVKCFAAWMGEITRMSKGTYKVARGSGGDEVNPIHLVNAWCSANRMVLGQIKTDVKSNEIKAVPELLDLLSLRDCIVTVDALNTQKAIMAKVVNEKKADYVAALKGNHPTLHDEVVSYFKDLEEGGFKPSEPLQIYNPKAEKGHGRIEKRQYYYSTDIDWLEDKKEWAKLTGIGMVIRKVTIGDKTTEERQYHLGSVETVDEYSLAVREHWGVESMHWELDVTFREDANHTRMDKSAENLALIRRLALNVVKKDTEKYPKKSLKIRRFNAALDPEYADYLLRINFGE